MLSQKGHLSSLWASALAIPSSSLPTPPTILSPGSHPSPIQSKTFIYHHFPQDACPDALCASTSPFTHPILMLTTLTVTPSLVLCLHDSTCTPQGQGPSPLHHISIAGVEPDIQEELHKHVFNEKTCTAYIQNTEAAQGTQRLTAFRNCLRKRNSYTGLRRAQEPPGQQWEGSTEVTPESGAILAALSCAVSTRAKPSSLTHPTVSTWASRVHPGPALPNSQDPGA